MARQVKDTALAHMFVTLQVLAEKEAVAERLVRVFAVPEAPGSAHEESERPTWTVYVAVSEYAEEARHAAYRFKGLFSPQIDSIVNVKGRPVVYLREPGPKRSWAIIADFDTVAVRRVTK